VSDGPTRIGWKQAAREYHKARAGRPSVVETSPERLARLRRLLNDNVSLERAWAELNDPRNRPTPEATIEAVWHCIRERGVAALTEPANTARLGIFDNAARAPNCSGVLRRCGAQLRRNGREHDTDFRGGVPSGRHHSSRPER
jgi:hypothetical protein